MRKNVVIPFVLILLAGCGGGEDPAGPTASREPVPGGAAVIGMISDLDSWNEYLARQTSSLKVLRRVYLPLAREIRESGSAGSKLEPVLAESWTLSRDGRSVTFRLHDTAWSDGTPFTADDVRYTWTAQVAPEVAWSGADAKSAIRDVVVVDDRTVTFELERAYPELMIDIVTGGILPKHVFGQVPFPDWHTHDWSGADVGIGPYLPDGHRPGEEIRLKRNPSFYRPGLPHLDRIVYRIVPDMGNLILQLRAGTVDLVDGIAPWQADSLLESPSLEIREVHNLGYDYIGWNGSRPPLDDPEVRRALTLAIDRKGIVEQLLYGYGRVSAGPVPGTYRFPVQGEPWPYDPEQAGEILASKGFTLKDGVRVRNGVPLEIEMTTNAGNEVRNMVMVRIQEQLGRIGVRVRLRPPMQMRAFVSRNLSGDFDAYVGGWAFDGKVELKALFSSDAIPPDGFNVVRYDSPAADEALAGLQEAITGPVFTGRLQELQDRIHLDQPYTFLYESTRLVASSNRLHDLVLDVQGDALGRLEQAWIEP